MAEYIITCGCGHKFRAWTPQEGFAELKKHAKLQHPGIACGWDMTLEGFTHIGSILVKLMEGT